MILGITGGTGCGKTTLLALLEQHGYRIVDCDALYHRLLATDRGLLAAIEKRFPGVVEGGVLQRKKLGAQVFTDPAALGDLNAITTPFVVSAVETLVQEGGDWAVDAIRLVESGLAALCHTTVAVTAPRQARIQRLMARDGISEDYAQSRIDAQPGDGFYRQNTHHILENNGTLQEFNAKCLAFLAGLGIM